MDVKGGQIPLDRRRSKSSRNPESNGSIASRLLDRTLDYETAIVRPRSIRAAARV
jgi:hypothetical protein